MRLVAAACGVLGLLGCSTGTGTPAPASGRGPVAPAPDLIAPAPARSGESVGVATMDAQGTITLQLRATGPGVVGDGMFSYPKTHAQYDYILKHLGGIKPGEKKPVAPFPE